MASFMLGILVLIGAFLLSIKSVRNELSTKPEIVIIYFFVAIIFILSIFFSVKDVKSKYYNVGIEHYINGDCQLIEEVVDGEVKDYYFKIIPTDYD